LIFFFPSGKREKNIIHEILLILSKEKNEPEMKKTSLVTGLNGCNSLTSNNSQRYGHRVDYG